MDIKIKLSYLPNLKFRLNEKLQKYE